ncbi:hypothetical protein F7725_028795 [Dissostichus mawsoni]|uniref:Uncharacterized protein n=1 Tax=Dissostichus mawsoni TaxID=36200 RepID=A0A7J5XI19_DISMA|nr:hypothetical protein F7725_028795 [Dissostichus mawsoni]
MIAAQPLADSEASQRSTSSFLQTQSDMIAAQPLADSEASQRSTSSFLQDIDSGKHCAPLGGTKLPIGTPHSSADSSSMNWARWSGSYSGVSFFRSFAKSWSGSLRCTALLIAMNLSLVMTEAGKRTLRLRSLDVFQRTSHMVRPNECRTLSDMIAAQPLADSEASQRSTSSFLQTQSDMIAAQPLADSEASQRSTSSFLQTQSDMIVAQPLADSDASQRSTSSFLQTSKSNGIVPFHKVPTAEQLRATRHPQNLKQHHGQCDDRYDEAEKKMSNDIDELMDESSDATDYDDADFVPESRTQNQRKSSYPQSEKSLGISTGQSGDSTTCSVKPSSSRMSGGYSSTVTSSSSHFSENTSPKKSSINVTALPNTTKQKYNKKQYCLYCKKAISKLARHLESAHSEQPDVSKAFGFNKRSRERRQMLRSLKKRGNLTIMLPLQAVVLEKWLLVEDLLKRNNLMTTVTASFVRDSMQEIAYGDMLKTALRSLMRESLKVGENGSTLIYQNLIQFRKQFGRLPDDISSVVRSERDILSLGESLYNARKPHEKRNDYIRQKMRDGKTFNNSKSNKSFEKSRRSCYAQ